MTQATTTHRGKTLTLKKPRGQVQAVAVCEVLHGTQHMLQVAYSHDLDAEAVQAWIESLPTDEVVEVVPPGVRLALIPLASVIGELRKQ